MIFSRFLLVIVVFFIPLTSYAKEPVKLFLPYGKTSNMFSVKLIKMLVERISGHPVEPVPFYLPGKKLVTQGSWMNAAVDGDVIWGTGVNGLFLKKNKYMFDQLDIRAVRGPLTKEFMKTVFQITTPEVFGDPLLLVPQFFPEFQRAQDPLFEYTLIVHESDVYYFPKFLYPHAVYMIDPWDLVLERVLNSKLIVSTALTGLVIGEAYGIPTRMLRMWENEASFDVQDYYYGTGRSTFEYATSLPEALLMGGEIPPICDLEKLLNAFPFDLWE